MACRWAFPWRHSVYDAGLRALLEVKLEFVVEIGRAFARQEETQTSEEFSQHRGTLSLIEDQ